MANNLTDHYSMVKVTTVQIGFLESIWGKTIQYNDGFSLELFRDGRHLGSIRTDQDAHQARKGDTILSVNLGDFTLSLSDKLHTRDAYTLTYDAEVLVRVLDPRIFAICYNQQLDPMGKTRDAIHAALVKRFERQAHDSIEATDLRFAVENNVESAVLVRSQLEQRDLLLLRTLGVAIVQAQKVIPYADPRRAAELEEEHRVALEKARVKADLDLKLAQQEAAAKLDAAAMQNQAEQAQRKAEIDAELAEKERVIQATYDRKKLEADEVLDEIRRRKAVRVLEESLEDEAKRKDHERHQGLLDEAKNLDVLRARVLVEEDIKLYRKLRAEAIPEADIRRDYPELTYLVERRDQVGGLLPSGERAALIGGTTPSENETTGNASQAMPQTVHGVAHKPRDRETDVYTLSHLGLEVTQVLLTSVQMQWSETSSNLAYLVQRVDTTFPGEQPFSPGDHILQLADRPVPPINTVGDLLDSLERQGQQIKVVILRGEHIKALFVSIPSLNRGSSSGG